jgi:pimeloyl-ACP methyl ester carboxylesterase
MVVRTAAAKCLYNWPTARPTVAKPGATEEGRKEIEAKNKQINEIAQPIIKAKFRALFELLKRMKSDKKLADRVGEKSKDNEARLLKWLTVYGMERITSEERRDNVDAWDIFWTKVEKDGTDLTYRFDDDRSSTDVGGGENVNSRTTERKDKKKSTSTHLMVMPDFGFPDNYFEPYIYDFTEYFKLSTFVMPSGSKIGRPYVPDPRDKTPPTQGAYYFPTEKIGKLFVDQRKKEGGTIGMICHGMAANIAMEYAKADPEGCAFIVCAGANTGFKTETAARQNAENKGELAVKWFFKLSKFPKPEHTEEQGFDEVTGGISYLFADPLNYDQLVVWSTRNQWARNGGMDTDGKQTLIDDKYEFSAPQPVNVPALFIWGEADPVVSQDAISSIKKSFPNAVFVEKMKGVSRLPWLEDPIGFQDTFLKFMDDKKVWKRIEKAKETADKAAEKEATKGDKKAS